MRLTQIDYRCANTISSRSKSWPSYWTEVTTQRKVSLLSNSTANTILLKQSTQSQDVATRQADHRNESCHEQQPCSLVEGGASCWQLLDWRNRWSAEPIRITSTGNEGGEGMLLQWVATRKWAGLARSVPQQGTAWLAYHCKHWLPTNKQRWL